MDTERKRKRKRFDASLGLWLSRGEIRLVESSARASGMNKSEYLRGICDLVARGKMPKLPQAAIPADDSPIPMPDKRSMVVIRVGKDMLRSLEEVADRKGATVAALVRVAALTGLLLAPAELPAGTTALPCVTDESLDRVAEQIRRIGINYNQTVRAVNTIAYWVRGGGPEDEDDVELYWDILRGVARSNEEVAGGLHETAKAAAKAAEEAGFAFDVEALLTGTRGRR